MSKKIRNPVAEAASYLTKPARHRDRKHDYHRNEKHRKRDTEDEALAEFRARRRAEKYASESEDWSSDSEWELAGFDWLEPIEESPPTGEVQ